VLSEVIPFEMIFTTAAQYNINILEQSFCSLGTQTSDGFLLDLLDLFTSDFNQQHLDLVTLKLN